MFIWRGLCRRDGEGEFRPSEFLGFSGPYPSAVHLHDDPAEIESHAETCRTSGARGVPFEKFFGVRTFETFAVVFYRNLQSRFRTDRAEHDGGVRFFRMFRGVLQKVRNHLLKLQPIEFDESEVATHAVDETDFRPHFGIDFELRDEQLVDQNLLFEERYRTGFVILYRKELGEEFSGTHELGVERGELFLEPLLRESGFQIVEKSVRLENRVGDGGFDFVRNNADEFFLLIDEVVVFDGLLVDFAVEVDTYVLQLRVRFHAFQLEFQKEREFSQFRRLFRRIRVREGLFSKEQIPVNLAVAVQGKREERLGRKVFFRVFGIRLVRHEHLVVHEFRNLRIRMEKRVQPRSRFVFGERHMAKSGSENPRAFGLEDRVEVERVHSARDLAFEGGYFFLERGDFWVSKQLRAEEIGRNGVPDERDHRFRERIFIGIRPVIDYRRAVGESRVEVFVHHRRPYSHDRRRPRDGVFSGERSRMEIVPPERVECVKGESEVEEHDFLFQYPDTEHRQYQLEYEAEAYERTCGEKEALQSHEVESLLFSDLFHRIPNQSYDRREMEDRVDGEERSEDFAVYAFRVREFQASDNRRSERIGREKGEIRQRRAYGGGVHDFRGLGGEVPHEKPERPSGADADSEIQSRKEKQEHLVFDSREKQEVEEEPRRNENREKEKVPPERISVLFEYERSAYGRERDCHDVREGIVAHVRLVKPRIVTHFARAYGET